MASQPELTEAISRTGLAAAPIGHDVDAAAVFRSIAIPPGGAASGGAGPGDAASSGSGPGGGGPGAASGAGAPSGGGPGAGGRGGGGGPRVLGLLTELAEAMVEDLVRLGKGWRADLIVFEPTAFAGPLAAAKLGIPAVRHLYGTDLMSVVAKFLPDALAPLCDKLGLDTVDPLGVATVDPCPAGLQVPVGSRRLPIRYVPYNGPGTLPGGFRKPPDRPRVCVTWGTTMSRLDPDLFLAGQVLRALGELDLDLVAAVTTGQRDLLGELPPQVRVIESTPLHLLLPRCDLVVAHGGAGSLLTTVTNGLPQLLIPRLPDHVRHSGRLAEAGAGTVLTPAAAEPSAIREQVTELLANPGYRIAAKRLQAQLHDQPVPAQVVGELEAIAAR